ncbi:MAG: TrmB family transcriptional regulator [Luteibaculum sp.]
MGNHQLLIEKLIEVGFSKYEARAYGVLIKDGPQTASYISEKAEIPQGRIYDVMKTLMSKGFCSVLLGSVKKYSPNDPKTSFNDLIENQRNALSNIENLQGELKEFYEEKKGEDPGLELVSVITSRQSQIERFTELLLSAQHRVLSMNKAPYAIGYKDPSDYDGLMKNIKILSGKGVKIKAIYEADYSETQENFIQWLEFNERYGVEIRVCEQVPTKMLIRDFNQLMVSVKSDKQINSLSSMIVESEELSSAMTDLFEMYWASGMKISSFKQLCEQASASSR